MCGIVGVASLKSLSNRRWLKVARDSMVHRGHDGKGEWWSSDGRVGFAHRRLAIIDLSPNANQPMADVTGKYVIVFNGEIYNYKDLKNILTGRGHVFRSNSDTEVMLEAYKKWGIDCLNYITGAFACAIYDGKSQKVFFARDRAGEKPLFYSYANGTLVFASELKAIMSDPNFRRLLDTRVRQS